MSHSHTLSLILSLPAAQLKHVDWHAGADLFLSLFHAIVEDLKELLRLLLLVQLIIERVLRGVMTGNYIKHRHLQDPGIRMDWAAPVLTWICVFPPLRRAIPSRMLSSKIRSFLELTMRSMTSSEAPTLSNMHWISATLVPGLSESCPGEPPKHIHAHM